MTNWHPHAEHLAGYASGTLSDGMSLLVSAHLTYCPACRRQVSQLEALAANQFHDDVTGIDAPRLDLALAALDEQSTDLPLQTPRAAPGSPLPAPLRHALGADIDELRWGMRLPGVSEYVLGGYEGEKVSLMRVRPGRRMPHHTHDGEEATLILSGVMEDDGKTFQTGDLAIADHRDDHQPHVTGDETCYCLIVLSGTLRFTGPFSRFLNVLPG
ncbi:ChrR family anti-sigma-E factor [Algicella marina]|uniref:Cupin domain-containing protein n=1 Tax=Algicella marina TaxID=2683284 RepID=A0A6P1T4I4_9RHOB|nr:ChrR family anti-sigma-E factor [Algicella marina]QHQ35452.1 cupin domain-containing protein [Algicella marina]